MNRPPRAVTTAHRLLVLSTAIAVAAAPHGRGAAASSHWPTFTMAASDAYDEGLMFSNDGAKVFLQDRSSLKFETDACGLLVSVPNRKAKFAQSALADDLDDFDGDDPSVEGQVLLTRWLSMHPEIAVVTDGIDKWCGDESFVGDDVVPDSIASWRSPDIGPPATAYIA